MITPPKKARMLSALKAYRKRYITDELADLDESGTRLMINDFLTDILGYQSLEEIKTEYMIRGTYADYVVQTKGTRHFLVEVKALSFNLSDKHLRQAVNYGANEGIEWALLTNGRSFELYKIIFEKPINYKKVFGFELDDQRKLKEIVEGLQYLHRDAVNKKSLNELWNKHAALDPLTLGGLLYLDPIFNSIKRELKRNFKCKFDDGDIRDALGVLISNANDPEKIRTFRARRTRKNIIEPVRTIVAALPEAQEAPGEGGSVGVN